MRGRLDGDISLQIGYFVIGNETGLQARFVLHIGLKLGEVFISMGLNIRLEPPYLDSSCLWECTLVEFVSNSHITQHSTNHTNSTAFCTSS